MRRPDILLEFPYIRVRLACRHCPRAGVYRLARLAVKFGCEITLDDLLLKLTGDCPHWTRNRRWPEGCGAYYPDIEGPRRPPDDPGAGRLRVIRGGK